MQSTQPPFVRTPAHADLPGVSKSAHLLNAHFSGPHGIAYGFLDLVNADACIDCIRRPKQIAGRLDRLSRLRADYDVRLDGGKAARLVVFNDATALLLEKQGSDWTRIHLHVFDFRSEVDDPTSRKTYDLTLVPPSDVKAAGRTMAHWLQERQNNPCSEIHFYERATPHNQKLCGEPVQNGQVTDPFVLQTYHQLQAEVGWYLDNLPLPSHASPSLALPFNKMSAATQDRVVRRANAAMAHALTKITDVERQAIKDCRLELYQPLVQPDEAPAFHMDQGVPHKGLAAPNTYDSLALIRQSILQAIADDPLIDPMACLAQKILRGRTIPVAVKGLKAVAEFSAHDLIEASM